ncbi:MAG: TetR/AcrR family transcriptional regulator [Desulfosalsimonadaceae bacterium]
MTNLQEAPTTYFIEKHYKDAFDRIGKDKQQRILDAAIAEFAALGFIAANINVIAKNAGISIGSMYNYFESKERLFLTIVDHGYAVLEKVISSVDLTKGDIFDKLEMMLRLAQDYSRQYPELSQIYLDLTSGGLAHLSKTVSRQMESITADFYQTMMADAKKAGIMASDLDERVTAFCLDNLMVMLQFSATSAYYKERLKIFAGEDAVDDEKIIQGMMRFIRRALAPQPQA